MKTKKFILIAALLLTVTTCFPQQVVYNQTCIINGQVTYGDSTSVPNSCLYLEPPPQLWSYQFYKDLYYYWEMKDVRQSAQGEQAVRYADVSTENLCKIWSSVAGFEISEERTPEIFKLINSSKECAGTLGTMGAKTFYSRLRPFLFLREKSLLPNDETFLSTNGSYPSGHTAIVRLIAEIFCELDPLGSANYQNLAREWGWSRVICGVHWKSDVDAGHVVGQHIFKHYLMQHEGFLKQLELAKKEFHTIHQ